MKFLLYRTINAFRSQSLNESGEPKNPLKILIPRWERLSVRQPPGDVRSFGHDLSEPGEKHGSELISRYGNELEADIKIPPLNYRGRMTFAISIGPGQTAAFDGFSLMPVDGYSGWRPQAVEVLKQIKVPIIRYPGGCFASFYDWTDGVGPRIDRKPKVPEYWGGLEENQAGTAEFIQLCRMTGSRPFLCVNMLTGNAIHAAEWVQYCNGNRSTLMGAVRESHGFSEPFNVRYWELDNETYRRYGWEVISVLPILITWQIPGVRTLLNAQKIPCSSQQQEGYLN